MSKTLKDLEHNGGEDFSGEFPNRNFKSIQPTAEVVNDAIEKKRQKLQEEYLNSDAAWNEF